MKFNYFDKFIKRRRDIAKLYDEGLFGISDLLPHPRSNNDYFDVYQNYVIRTKRRNELVTHLRALGVEVLISWPVPMHKQKTLGLNHFNLPVTEQMSDEVLSLPMYPELTNGEVEIVIDAVRNFYT